jgi:L-galactose dehydrogenase
MEYRTLGRTGLRVSPIGFGASPLGEEFGAIDPAEGERAVHLAIERGIDFFDTSPFYGRTLSEIRLGQALEGHRSEVILATKCGRYGSEEFDFSASRVARSVEESLRRLKTDYLDLLYAHDIEYGDPAGIIGETIPALDRLKREGKVRFIGISGFPPAYLRQVAEAVPVDVILSYARYNLMVRDLDTHLSPFCRRTGTGLVNASPLHLRILTAQGAPEWHPAPVEVKEAGRRVVEYLESRGIEAPVAALRYALDHPYAASTLVGIGCRAQVEQNLKALDYRIPAGIQEGIDEIVAPVLNRVWTVGRPENQG